MWQRKLNIGLGRFVTDCLTLYMKNDEEFAAIDFETANQHRSSVCSVGVVIVRNSQVVDKFYRLIHPIPDFIHTGIRRYMG